MKNKTMEIKEIKNEQKEYEDFMERYADDMMTDQEFDSFYVYGPLSASYWKSKQRILVCNLEPYDEREGKIIVDINLFKKWMTVNTGKFTAKFITGLLKAFHDQGILKDTIRFKDFSIQELLFYMKDIAYMNFRMSSGNNVKADKNGIFCEVNTHKDYLKDQINNLSPDIIIIGGVDGCKAFNILFDSNIKYNTTSVFNDKVICSIKHFSRANYLSYNNKISEIINCFSKESQSANASN